MFGLWYIVIGLAIIATVLIILGCSVEKLRDKYEKNLQYGENGYSETYHGCGYQKKYIPAEKLPIYEKNLKKYEFWAHMYCADVNEWLCGFGIFFAIVAVIFIFVAIFVPLGAQAEAVYWQEFVPMVENILSGSDNLQSIGITEEIIEYNKWLSRARSDQEFWGNWSQYNGIDLSGLKYITIGQ